MTTMKTLICILFFSVSNTILAQKEHVISNGTAKVHFLVFGEGEPILLINGGPGMNCVGFIPLAKQLSVDHQVILYDQRGTGQSTVDEVTTETITMDAMVSDIEAIRKYLKVSDWIVFGHSFGGIMAYYYAAKYPQCVSAMVQSSSGGMDLQLLENLNITASLSPRERDSLSFYTNRINSGDTSHYTALKRGEFLAPLYVYNTSFVPVIAERLTQGNSEINALVWQNLRSIPYDTKDAMRNFQKPVLILHGKQDIVDLNIPQLSNEILPNSSLVILENCKHYGWLDAKEQYFLAINTFFNDL